MPRSWDTSVTSSSGSRSLPEPRNAYAGYLAWRARVSEVSVVIPTMNEEASIGRVIDEVRKALADRLPDFLAALESGRADFVSGERLSHLAGGAMSGMHRIGNAILNAAFHLLFRAPIRDSQS